MSINKKINLTMGIVTIVILLSIAITWINLMEINRDIDEALVEKKESVQIINQIKLNASKQGLYSRSIFVENTIENQNLLLQSINDLNSDIEKLSNFDLNLEEEKQLEILKQENKLFTENYPSMLTALNENKIENAKSILNNYIKPANLKIAQSSDIILESQNKKLEEIKKSTDSSLESSQRILICFVLEVFLFMGFITWFIHYRIIKPLVLLIKSVNEISKGNLNIKNVEVKFNDEIGTLAAGFNNMKEKLHDLINGIQISASQLRESSIRLTVNTDEISASSEEITSQIATSADISVSSSQSLNDSAKAIDETAKGVEVIAVASQQLQMLSDETKKIADDGDLIILNAQDQMSTIFVSTEKVKSLVLKLSKQISEIENISKIISNVTDQTNLLALNAAIEAARAGEVGKGFAVVADEVKKLSNESKKSAILINELTIEIQTDTKDVQLAVEKALNAVNDGVQIITSAGDSFENIVDDVNKMYVQISDVSATSEQLSASAEEVAASITEIVSGSENASEGLITIAAAMEEQSATMVDMNEIAIQLNENARLLQEKIDNFNV